MAYRVTWSPDAIRDIDAISEYVAKSSPRYAIVVAGKIFDVMQPLRQFPRMGRIVPEIGEDNFREVFVYDYRVLYRIDDERLRVFAVIHGARNLSAALMNRPV